MELINQKTKRIMEGCKERAREAGLSFQDETLEYIVTNSDLLELSPKVMIPTLYDYWVHDVEVLREKGNYELYPSNPYETVINTRPPISFYNDNNPDWLNVMIFYHVLAHIDCFQNNNYFSNTWDYDFNAQALSDKRILSRLRSEKGRWVDYVIEFARGADNLVSYFDTIDRSNYTIQSTESKVIDFYFDTFLQSVLQLPVSDYIKEVERYNYCIHADATGGEAKFFSEVRNKHPEFDSLLEKNAHHHSYERRDILQFIMDHSPFLNKEKNGWMKTVMEIVRTTSLFFQPQIRTKIINEGWASYWHEHLFLADERIRGHEVDFARINAGVVSMPRVGLNPYALGMRLFNYIEHLGDTGKYSLPFRLLHTTHERKNFDTKAMSGKELIFWTRTNLCDSLLLDTFIDQDFVDKNNLFVTGKRLDPQRMVWQYYVKSRSATEYKKMLNESLYHPPHIEVDVKKSAGPILYLNHFFEGKPLVFDYLFNTMVGLEYLWGNPVQLETSEVTSSATPSESAVQSSVTQLNWQRVRYTMKDRQMSKEMI